MNREIINNLLDIKESYELTGTLFELLNNQEKREETFEKFLTCSPDLTFDWFVDYFQEEQGDRKSLKQDFTPNCLCELLEELEDDYETFADICAGTGGLTIHAWNKRPEAFYHCEELSERAIAILLFNMAIRNMNGEIICGDVLSGEKSRIYSLQRGGSSAISQFQNMKQGISMMCV